MAACQLSILLPGHSGSTCHRHVLWLGCRRYLLFSFVEPPASFRLLEWGLQSVLAGHATIRKAVIFVDRCNIRLHQRASPDRRFIPVHILTCKSWDSMGFPTRPPANSSHKKVTSRKSRGLVDEPFIRRCCNNRRLAKM